MKRLVFCIGIILLINLAKAQSIISFSPSEAKRGDTVHYTIRCSNINLTSYTPENFWIVLWDQAGMGKHNQYGIRIDSVVIVNDSVLKGVFIVTNYTYDISTMLMIGIRPYTEDFKYITLNDAFTVKGGLECARFLSITPESINSMETALMRITCSGTSFTKNPESVFIHLSDSLYNSAYFWGVTVLNDSVVECYVGFASNSDDFSRHDVRMDLEIGCKDGYLIADNVFSVYQWKFDAIVPNVARRREHVPVTLHFKDTRLESCFGHDPINFPFVFIMDSITKLSLDSAIILNDTTITGVFNIPWTTRDGSYDLFIMGCQYFLAKDAFEIRGEIPLTIASESPMIVYPNPSSGRLYMDVNLTATDPYQLSIMNSTGALIFSKTQPAPPLPGMQMITVDNNDIYLEQGFYFVQVKQNDQVQSAKIQVH